MISPLRRFAFIHIPKTGGTSIEAALADPSCVCRSGERHPEFAAPLNHLTLGELRRFCESRQIPLDTGRTFAFVRNPWDKVISECFCPHVRHAFRQGADVRERIGTVCEMAADGYGNHFLPQSRFLADHRGEVGLIGRYETLSADLEALCGDLGIPLRPLPLLNTSSRGRYVDYYDRETRALVARTYREDIERFDYRFGD